MKNVYLEILILFILIAANGYFSLSEFSIIASKRSRLKRMTREGNRGAKRALKIYSRPELFLGAVQIGITFVGIMAGVFSGATIVVYITPLIREIPIEIISASARPIASILVAVVVTLTAVIIGELVPKYIALSRPEKIAASVSGPISWFIKISSLPVWVLTGISKSIIRFFGIRQTSESSTHTGEEIDLIIAEGREKGLFDATEQELIHSVFDFTDTTARQAMTPRTDIIGIDIAEETDVIINKIILHGFSRFPVFDKTLDKIVGILYTKDVLRVLQSSKLIILNDIIRKPLFVPDSLMLKELLRMFQKKRVHAAIVLDEFGGTAGLITLEDLLEEIVGEIHDEFDTDQDEFVKKSDKVAFVAAVLRIDELNDQFETNLSEAGADTVGGLVFDNFGYPAKKGEEIVIENLKFTVLEVQGNRLKRLKVEKQ